MMEVIRRLLQHKPSTPGWRLLCSILSNSNELEDLSEEIDATVSAWPVHVRHAAFARSHSSCAPWVISDEHLPLWWKWVGSLSLSDTYVNDEHFHPPSNPAIAKLELRSPPHIYQVSHLLDCVPKASHLKICDFNAHDNNAVLKEILEGKPWNAVSLVNVGLQPCNIEKNIKKIDSRPLREIDLAGNAIGDKGLELLGTWCNFGQLRSLGLDSTRFTPEGFEHLLSTSSFPNLRQLDITQSSMIMTDVAAITKLADTIQTLRLAYTNLLDEGVEEIAQIPWQQLQHLDIRACSFGEGGIEALSNSSCARTLRCLELDLLNLSDRPSILKHIFSAEDSWQQLAAMSLRSTSLNDQAILQIRDAKSNIPLSHLDLSQNNITDRGAKTISESPIFESLQVLDLRHNPISDTGAQILLDASTKRHDFVCFLSIEALSNRTTSHIKQKWPENIEPFGRLRCDV